jgi:hypothetical protein
MYKRLTGIIFGCETMQIKQLKKIQLFCQSINCIKIEECFQVLKYGLRLLNTKAFYNNCYALTLLIFCIKGYHDSIFTN